PRWMDCMSGWTRGTGCFICDIQGQAQKWLEFAAKSLRTSQVDCGISARFGGSRFARVVFLIVLALSRPPIDLWQRRRWRRLLPAQTRPAASLSTRQLA